MNLNEVMRFYVRVGTAFMKHTYNLQLVPDFKLKNNIL